MRGRKGGESRPFLSDVRRENAEQEVRGDDPELASYLRIKEREVEAVSAS
jgi:hypothetical protein